MDGGEGSIAEVGGGAADTFEGACLFNPVPVVVGDGEGFLVQGAGLVGVSGEPAQGTEMVEGFGLIVGCDHGA